MRVLLKQIMKASGTPVLQTCESGVENILSAGNIWTSAHARRIELTERGLKPGAILCSEIDSFQAVIDFVACAIGSFVYLPVAPSRLIALNQELAGSPVSDKVGIFFASELAGETFYPNMLPESLASIRSSFSPQMVFYEDQKVSLDNFRVLSGDQLADLLADLSVQFETPLGGTRLTCGLAHYDQSFAVDLLLGLHQKQTIFIRKSLCYAGTDFVQEAVDLEVDDLVVCPSIFDDMARLIDHLSAEDYSKLRRIRLHTGGRELTKEQARLASEIFNRVFAETLSCISSGTYHARSEQVTRVGQLPDQKASRSLAS